MFLFLSHYPAKNFLTFWIFLFCLTFTSSANAISIAPAILEIEIEPGSAETFSLNVSTPSTQPITYYTSSQNFEPRGETGYPYFTTTDENLASWITVQPELEVLPNTVNELEFTITVPENTPAAGYFAALFLGNQPTTLSDQNNQSQVSLGGKVGTLILLTVPGDMVDKAGIVEFDTENGQRFFSSLPISTFYRFANDGADRVVPNGFIELHNLLSFRSGQQFPVNPQKSSVLPSSIRLFEQTLGPQDSYESKNFISNYFKSAAFQFSNFNMGVYNLYLNVSWGSSLTSKDSTDITLIIFPWQLLSLLSLSLLIIVFGFKRYNAWILRLNSHILIKKPSKSTQITLAKKTSSKATPKKSKTTNSKKTSKVSKPKKQNKLDNE